jgi:hypothetical protein
MDVREGFHASGCRAPHGHVSPIDHPDHKVHDPARERRKGGVLIAGTIGASTAVASTRGAGIFCLDGERAARAKGNLDASEVHRPHEGRLRCSSSKVVVCACCGGTCRHVKLTPRQHMLQKAKLNALGSCV